MKFTYVFQPYSTRVQAEFLNTMPPREFVDCITDDLLGQGVFVFTPSGAPMRLPKVRCQGFAQRDTF